VRDPGTEEDQNKEQLASYPQCISALQRCEEVDSSSGSSSPALLIDVFCG